MAAKTGECSEIRNGAEVAITFRCGHYMLSLCERCTDRIARGERLQILVERQYGRKNSHGYVNHTPITEEEWEQLPPGERCYLDVSLQPTRQSVLEANGRRA